MNNSGVGRKTPKKQTNFYPRIVCSMWLILSRFSGEVIQRVDNDNNKGRKRTKNSLEPFIRLEKDILVAKKICQEIFLNFTHFVLLRLINNIQNFSLIIFSNHHKKIYIMFSFFFFRMI